MEDGLGEEAPPEEEGEQAVPDGTGNSPTMGKATKPDEPAQDESDRVHVPYQCRSMMGCPPSGRQTTVPPFMKALIAAVAERRREMGPGSNSSRMPRLACGSRTNGGKTAVTTT